MVVRIFSYKVRFLGIRYFGLNRFYREKRKYSVFDFMRIWCGGWRVV